MLLASVLDALNATLEHQYEENRRFVEVIVKSHRRFEALRDFTVDGALDHVDRMAMDRKDAGESTGVRSPVRNASLESSRSHPSTRSTSLEGVPEHDAFAIGEDDEDDDETPRESARTGSINDTETAVPTQSRSMSEKARGKQPVGSNSFSRSTSRNTSNTSLSALNTSQSHASPQQFTPNNEWVSLESSLRNPQ